MQVTTSIKPITPMVAPITTASAVYTSPDALTFTMVKDLRLYNGHTADVTVQMWYVPFGGAASIANQICNSIIRSKQTVPITFPIAIGAQGSLMVVASVASVVGVNGLLIEYQTVA